MASKEKWLPQVDTAYIVRIVGRARTQEDIDAEIKAIEERLMAFETDYNKSGKLRMHINPR